ncbi:MAG TPA: TonB-dependent receptor [Cellvibrionaceae bacterium]|nr:TonB-dependent receptor [Cellvibrionaceae bacterium]HMW47068.1 TonB-dependent receptor [Cellvibrionaceae bacterium]HMW71304.1 TonB-dependent receptor [Cellvibrionaceae bacterium]HMY38612.1 TonB-dependent receptor [Marinagarivorans sp.]HNG60562.1 TonB-dependent receptor [Cellvibrionaceae bacterium]
MYPVYGVKVNVDTAQVASPLVPLVGYETGVHLGAPDDVLQVSIAAWALNIDSELIFVGDAGTTEDTAVGSARHGIELSSAWQFNPQLRWELEYSNSRAALDEAIDGRRTIAGSLRHTILNEFLFTPTDRWSASLRVRYFSSYPLDDGAWAPASQLVNARLHYAAEHWQLRLDLLNLLNSDDHDIEYFYASSLQGESMPYEDHHYHVFEPRSVRITWRYTP